MCSLLLWDNVFSLTLICLCLDLDLDLDLDWSYYFNEVSYVYNRSFLWTRLFISLYRSCYYYEEGSLFLLYSGVMLLLLYSGMLLLLYSGMLLLLYRLLLLYSGMMLLILLILSLIYLDCYFDCYFDCMIIDDDFDWIDLFLLIIVNNLAILFNNSNIYYLLYLDNLLSSL